MTSIWILFDPISSYGSYHIMIVWTIIILHLDKVTAINEGSIPHLDGICLDGQFAIIQTDGM
jgi:hypothetical protein